MKSQFLILSIGCLLILAGTFVSPAEALAQACPNTDYELTTQAEVDTFPNNCTVVTGSLAIRGSEITDLATLAAITSIGQSLIIEQANALTGVDSLSGITSVGELRIEETGLNNLDGFAGLTSVGGNLRIQNNFSLPSLDGLSGLTSVGGNLTIRGDSALISLAGLSQLTFVGDNLQVTGNYALPNLDGLSGITAVPSNLYITSNEALTSLDALSGVNSVGATLLIDNNDALPNLDGLSGITSAGDLTISFNDALTSLAGLSGLTSVGGIVTIWENPALTSLAGNGITTIGGDLYIDNNDALTSLEGLSGLTSVEYITITENSALTSLDGLDGLTSVFVLEITNSDALENLMGLSGLVTASSLRIRNNSALTSLDGISGLTSVTSALEIDRNNALTDLNGLSGLTTVGELNIGFNDTLTSVAGLAALTTVDQVLRIENNGALVHLDGLSGVTSVEDLVIGENAVLAECSRGLYNLVNDGGVSRAITMFLNAPAGDCNNNGADLVAVDARVQFVHASPDPGLSVVDVYFDDVLIFDNFSFGTATPFMDVMGSQEIQIAVADSASATATNPIAVTAVTFQAGLTYHTIAAGFTDPSVFPPNPDGIDTAFRWYITDDALETSRVPGEFRTRLFHAFPDGITIDHYIDFSSGPFLLRNDLAYGTFTGYDGQNPAVFDGFVTPADGNANQKLLTGVGDFSNAADLAVLELLIGFFDATPSTDWPDLDWIFVYADGTVTVHPPTRVDVDNPPTGLPATFRLNSNYPNPFYESTTISFALPQPSDVTLTVVDLLGRKVRELVSGTKPAGTYEVSFQATPLSSGIYFYRLEAGDFVETRPMVVARR